MRSPLSACRAHSPLFAQVVAQGGIRRELVSLKNGHLIWTVYHGVVFPYTKTVEGVVVTQLDLYDILQAVPKDLDLDSVALAPAGGSELLVSVETAGARTTAVETARTRLFKGAAAPLPMDAVVKSHLAPFAHKLIPLVLGFGLGSLLLVLGVVYGSRRVSRRLIAPLIELTDVARQIAESGDLSIPMPRIDVGEVGQLATTFEVMVDTLRAAESTLENKVAQRTEELRKSEAAAEAASRAKSEFLSSMSHELRTPLNAVLGYAQLFAGDPELPEDKQEDAREIERAGQVLLSLVNEVLDLSRIESGRMELTMEALTVDALGAKSLQMVAGAAQAAGIELIDADGDGRNAVIQADPVRLLQVMLNLLTNAIKYNRPKGSVRLSYTLMGAQAVRIVVSDTGLGIPASKQERIFTAFDRLGFENGCIEGTGIGLLIAKRIVEAMDGRLGFDSVEGQGSSFWAEFPLAEPHSEYTAHRRNLRI